MGEGGSGAGEQVEELERGTAERQPPSPSSKLERLFKLNHAPPVPLPLPQQRNTTAKLYANRASGTHSTMASRGAHASGKLPQRNNKVAAPFKLPSRNSLHNSVAVRGAPVLQAGLHHVGGVLVLRQGHDLHV